MKRFLWYGLMAWIMAACGAPQDTIDLAGQWQVRLDSLDCGLTEGWQQQGFGQKISLPGTTDDAGLGVPNVWEPALTKPQLLHLTRKNSYVGAAWYTREVDIPAHWAGKPVVLCLERVLWESRVWVDGVEAADGEISLTTPHCHDLTALLTPGRHRLTLRIDNRKKRDISVRNLAHAYTDDTQIRWNGVLGKLELRRLPELSVAAVEVYPDAKEKKARVKVELRNVGQETFKGKLEYTLRLPGDGRTLPVMTSEYVVQPGQTVTEAVLSLGDSVWLWDEFHPDLYELEVSLRRGNDESRQQVSFGVRSLTREGNRLLMNGRPVFMRGTLECCVFPLSGYPPTTPEGWTKVFTTARAWGLNHLRFHSWCPPRAAFEAADRAGFYLQVELPVWSVTLGGDTLVEQFMYAEAARILKTYGNHPSFCFFSLGNELQKDFGMLGKMLSKVKESDPRHLYTTTSFTFEKGHGGWPEPGDDYFITQWTKQGWVRGQGVFNSQPPAFDKNYNRATEGLEVPLITHEIGQYAVYPRLAEIPKYTGVLDPLNFKAIANDLQAKGLEKRAEAYTLASGKLAALLYKEEIERALKTRGINGFQLLGLNDFPGQGTALVGLLDAFWDSKGVIEAEDFRQFCSPTVMLALFPKAVYTNAETFRAKLAFSHYGAENMEGTDYYWRLMHKEGRIAGGEGTLSRVEPGYIDSIGSVEVALSEIKEATRLILEVGLKDRSCRNRWSIWVYPERPIVDYGEVKFTRDYRQAMDWLTAGEKVLYNPDWKQLRGVEGKFVPVFWSPVHFPQQAGTMGVLCRPDHPALACFPTDFHSDWQWWDLNLHSVTLVIDSLQGGQPIVEMVDNFTNNRRLASLIEGGVGPGKLMLASFDLATDLDRRPVARQMLVSLLHYMNSAAFRPPVIEQPETLRALLYSDSPTQP